MIYSRFTCTTGSTVTISHVLKEENLPTGITRTYLLEIEPTAILQAWVRFHGPNDL